MSSFDLTAPSNATSRMSTDGLPSPEMSGQNSTVDISEYPFYGSGSAFYKSIVDLLSGTVPPSANTAQQPGGRADAWFTGNGEVPGRLKSTPTVDMRLGRGMPPTLTSESATGTQVISRQIATFSEATPEGQVGNKICDECYKATLGAQAGWETLSPVVLHSLKERTTKSENRKLIYEKLFRKWIGHGIRQESGSGWWSCDHSQLRGRAKVDDNPILNRVSYRVEVWCRWHVTRVNGGWEATLQDPDDKVNQAKKDYDLQRS